MTTRPVERRQTERKCILAAGLLAREQHQLPHDVVKRRADVVHVVTEDGAEPWRRLLNGVSTHHKVVCLGVPRWRGKSIRLAGQIRTELPIKLVAVLVCPVELRSSTYEARAFVVRLRSG